MKKANSSILFFIVFILYSFFASAENVDEIIAKHINAHGGAAKWAAVKSMKITGKFTGFSETKTFATVKTSSGIFYSDYELGKFRIEEAFNGKTGWTIDPWQEVTFPREFNAAETNVIVQKSELCTPFFNYKQKGHKVELVGRENVDGIDVYILKLTRSNKLEETWYLDAKTYLEFKCESQWVDFGWAIMAETFFDKFTEVNGLIIPFYVERSFGQRNRIEEIEKIDLNIAYDESKLIMPRSNEILKLKSLQGNWDVVVDVWTRRGTWYTIDSTTSVIGFSSTNMLQENIRYERVVPLTKINTWTYHSTSAKYRMTTYNAFDSSLDLYEGNFVETVDSLKKSTFNLVLTLEDTLTDTKVYSQYLITNISPDSFVVETKVSADNGVTWNLQDKLSYSRRKN